jgi:nucleotidyltransferase/DNA polymerase involved in DNA repair
MPFGLKNAKATYQHLVNMVFAKIIGKSFEVYIDDMLVKGSNFPQHLEHLAEVFQILKNTRLRLNPDKCTFGVSVNKFLGFMVSNWGIEANQNKIQAIEDLQLPGTLRGL